MLSVEQKDKTFSSSRVLNYKLFKLLYNQVKLIHVTLAQQEPLVKSLYSKVNGPLSDKTQPVLYCISNIQYTTLVLYSVNSDSLSRINIHI